MARSSTRDRSSSTLAARSIPEMVSQFAVEPNVLATRLAIFPISASVRQSKRSRVGYGTLMESNRLRLYAIGILL